MDSKKVYTKGSEVGYSLNALEKLLERRHLIQPAKQVSYEHWKQDRLKQPQNDAQTSSFNHYADVSMLNTVQKQVVNTIDGLMKPEETQLLLIQPVGKEATEKEETRVHL